MSNGAQCCAIGVCCDAAKRRQMLPAKIAAWRAGNGAPTATRGLKGPTEEESYLTFLDYLEAHQLTIAPVSMEQVIADVVEATHHRHGEAEHDPIKPE